MQAPFAQKALDKFITEFLLSGYNKIASEFSFEHLITTAELFGSANIKRVELWHKVSHLTSSALKVRNETKGDPISKQAVM